MAHHRSGTLVPRLEQAGLVALTAMAAAALFSIALAQTLLAIAVLCWLLVVVVNHERVEVPRFFWPLVAFAAATLVSTVMLPP